MNKHRFISSSLTSQTKSFQILGLGVKVSIRHGHQKGPLDFFNCSQKVFFLVSSSRKNKFHHFRPPYKNLKNPLMLSLEKIHLTPMALGLQLRLGLPFTFITFLPSLLHSRYVLLSRYRCWLNKI